VPRLRLWQDALVRANRDTGHFERSFDGMDKFDVPAPAADGEAAPLAACYWLTEPERTLPLTIERLAGVRAAQVLVANTYRGHLVELLGSTARHMHLCAQVARTIPVFRATRRKDAAEFEAVAKRFESELQALAGSALP
jgi:hypothetical protein